MKNQTDLDEATLRQQVRSTMEVKSISQAAVARAVGVDSARFNLWMNDKYTGNCLPIIEAVSSYIRREAEKKKSDKFNFKFELIANARRVFSVAEMCHLESEIGVVYGGAGVGKTWAVKAYAKKEVSSVILIETDLGYTAKILFQELHKKLGFDGGGSIHQMFNDVLSRLRNSYKLIIVDEAEHLPYRALELLRRLYDKAVDNEGTATIGILLSGMPKLVTNLRGKRGEYSQLYSRIGVAVNLPSITEDDIKTLVNQVLPNCNGLAKHYYTYSGGNGRLLSKMLPRSIRMAKTNDEPISESIIVDTMNWLLV